MPRAAARRTIIVDEFSRAAEGLRAHVDARFADPRRADEGRFVWDLWHVPGQYTSLRTPAWRYFPDAIYDRFHQQLVWWGRRVLGCHDVSPPWMSNYVNGCEQRLHGDLPHGHWAFVFSLTRWSKRTFKGGETLLLRDDVLDFWGGFASVRHQEEDELVEAIAPKFNRLTVFDPRLPHGVRRVDGSMDPREGRLVIHGWFVQPRPFIEGPLSTKALASEIERLTETLVTPALEEGLSLAGLLSVRFRVLADGRVSSAQVMSDTTRTVAELEPARRAFVREIVKHLSAARFPKARGASSVTLPLVFERG